MLMANLANGGSMEKLKIAIVEDERPHAEIIEGYLAQFGRERNVEISSELFTSGLDFVSDYKPEYDAILMDIEMPHMNGMDCAFRLRKTDGNVIIIFITSMVQYAVKGYEVAAMGYMLKPVKYTPFAILMDKVLQRVSTDKGMDIFIGGEDHARRISSRDLYYVEVLDHYLIYHTSEGQFKCLGRMKDAEEKLASQNFFRCSYGYLVNLRFVRGIEGSDVFVDKDVVQISRRRKKEFLIALNEYHNRGGV